MVKAASSIALFAALGALAVAGPAGAGPATGHAAAAKPKTTAAMVYDQGFTPPTIKIKRNGTIKWTWDNANADFHTVTLNSAPRGVGIFGSSRRAVNYSFSHKFTKVGKYVIFCTLHPGNQQKITVTK
ncbi:unannotated protein [freshwater metagenome]|uniref:Unannotated protein n=1 Tax=freshwater metagenome TaxID=449393 RepID=A0A6J5YZC1_9ZZZZ|nr:hypothetical protein [Actinomycetota bacterium]